MSQDRALVLGIFLLVLLPIALLPIFVLRLRGKRLDDTSLGTLPSEWKRADRAQKLRVWKAVRRGEPTTTPQDAQLALVLIDWQLAQRRKTRPLRLIHLAFSAFLIIGIVFMAAHGAGFSLAYVPFLALVAYGLFGKRKLEERLNRSRSLNEQLAALAPKAQNDPPWGREKTGLDRD